MRTCVDGSLITSQGAETAVRLVLNCSLSCRVMTWQKVSKRALLIWVAPSQKQYLVIDLRVFTSVECVERGLDPLRPSAADLTKDRKRQSAAVSPALRALGVPGRCRVLKLLRHTPIEVAPPLAWLCMAKALCRCVFGISQYVAPEDVVYSLTGSIY